MTTDPSRQGEPHPLDPEHAHCGTRTRGLPWLRRAAAVKEQIIATRMGQNEITIILSTWYFNVHYFAD